MVRFSIFIPSFYVPYWYLKSGLCLRSVFSAGYPDVLPCQPEVLRLSCRTIAFEPVWPALFQITRPFLQCTYP
jgi:hypothetical protein